MASARQSRERAGVAIVLIAVALVAGLFGLDRMRAPLPPLEKRDGPALSEVRTWGYQLQNVEPRRLPGGADLLVVDYSGDGTEGGRFTPGAVEAMKRRPDGGRRIVLAHLSIGEAENHRYYWSRTWSLVAPSWLGDADNQRSGNFAVRYWQPGWQSIVVNDRRSVLDSLSQTAAWGGPSYLDRILEAGFDGVYLGRVGAYSDWQKERPTADAEMVMLVRRISAYAKARKPGFLIVPQNGEGLLVSKSYRAAIDGIAKEDLIYGMGGDGRRNREADIVKTLALLSSAKGMGLPVFVVEYLDEGEKRREALKTATEFGFPILFAKRALDEPPVPVEPPPAQPAEAPQATTPGSAYVRN